MSGTTEGLSRKIASANELHAVVRSMKALAASSIGQYEKAVLSLNDYYRTVELGLMACLRQVEGDSIYPKVAATRKPRPTGAIIFGSDQGLVGRFNEVIAEFSVSTLHGLPSGAARIWAVGERIQVLLTDALPVPSTLLPVPISVKAITSLVDRILIEVEETRERGEWEELYIFYNCPKAGSAYEPVVKQLLPLDQIWQKKLVALPWPTKSRPEVIEGHLRALPAFIRGYLFVVLFRACAESLASENASRLAAMQRAEKNIEDVLTELNRTFHRNRQEAIDEELFDVVSGYEALSQQKITLN